MLLVVTTFASRGRTQHSADLVQDYVAARGWLEGVSPYGPLTDLQTRAGLPPLPDHVLVRVNPHPPGAILTTVPLAVGDFDVAVSAYRISQILLIAVAWTLVGRLTSPPGGTLGWTVTGGLFGLWAPIWQGLDWGQPVGLLACLTAGAWVAARRPSPVAFGVVVGLACTVRPFFAILFVVAAGWGGRGFGRATAGAVVGGLLPFLILGVTPWEWLGHARRAEGYIVESGSSAGLVGLGTDAAVALFGLAAIAVTVARMKGWSADRALAVAAVVGLMTYPLAWFQYDAALVPVVGVCAVRGVLANDRVGLIGLAVYVMLRTLPDVVAPNPDPFADWLGRNKGWLQLAARGLLLAVAVRVLGRADRGTT